VTDNRKGNKCSGASRIWWDRGGNNR